MSTTTRRPLRRRMLVAAVASLSMTSCDGFSTSQQRPLQLAAQHSKVIATTTAKATTSSVLFMSSSSIDDNDSTLSSSNSNSDNSNNENTNNKDSSSNDNNSIMRMPSPFKKLPPIQIDDPNLLFYDIFLLLNLSVSISFWVVNRMQLDFVALSFNEGCLMSILWIIAGLYHGAFLDSAKDGHQKPAYYIALDESDEKDSGETSNNQQQTGTANDSATEKPFWEKPLPALTKGGPSAAGLLAVNTFINTISLRLIVALVVAVVQHRAVFDDPLEQLIPYEVGFGLVLMSVWRTMHSVYTPRI